MEKLNGSRRQSRTEDAIAEALMHYGIEVSRAADGASHHLRGVLPTAPPQEIAIEVRRATSAPSTSRSVVGHDYVSPQLAAQYRQAGQHYVDALGNAHLPFRHFFVDVQGRLPAPPTETPELRPSTAFGAAGSRLVLLLISDPEYAARATVRDLAAETGVSVGTISSTLRDLSSNGFLTGSKNRRHVRNVRQLADLWVGTYLTRVSPKVREERLHGPEPRWWLTAPRPAGTALGGGTALAALGEDIIPETTLLYGKTPWAAARQAGRLTRDEPRNVLVREQFWPDRLTTREGTAPALVVYADALASNDPRQTIAAREFWEGSDVQALFDRE